MCTHNIDIELPKIFSKTNHFDKFQEATIDDEEFDHEEEAEYEG